MNTGFFTYRRVNIALFLASVAGMAFALFLEHYQGLEPCPLCIFQRVGLMTMGLFALIAAIHHPASMMVRRLYSGLAALGILWSTAVAGRHVWLQHLPADEVPSCGPGLNYWLEAFPLQSVVSKVLKGSGECAKVDWTMLGLSLPHWAFLFFMGLLMVSLCQIARRA